MTLENELYKIRLQLAAIIDAILRLLDYVNYIQNNSVTLGCKL